MATDPDEVIVVGRLGAPHGVRGELHLHSYTTPVENLLGYQPWLCRRRPTGKQAKRRTQVGDAVWQSFEFTGLRTHQDHFLASVTGYAEREDVAKLRGMEIGVPRSQLPELPEQEHYWRDLIGAQVISLDDQLLGSVAGLLETGVHDVLRVRRTEPGQSELLIPFVRAYVVAVTPDTLTVDWDPTWND